MAEQINRETEAKGTEQAEKAYERFLQYRDMRDAEDAKITSVMEAKRRNRVRVSRFAAAAAALVILIAFGGTMGAYARKNGGAFPWMEKDDEGMTMITSPEYMQMGTKVENTTVYYSRDEVPEKYRADVIEPTDLEALIGFSLQKIEIIEVGNFSKVINVFEDDKGEELKVGSVDYGGMIFFVRQEHEKYDYQENTQGEEQRLEILNNEEEGYTIYFVYEGKQYYVIGKFEPEFLEKLAKEYQKHIKK